MSPDPNGTYLSLIATTRHSRACALLSGIILQYVANASLDKGFQTIT